MPNFGDRTRHMIRIAITSAAYAAIAATLELGTVAVEPERQAGATATLSSGLQILGSQPCARAVCRSSMPQQI
jgi:hypothetical protein